MNISTQAFSANGINYRPADKPIVVICVDGSGDEYYNAALARGRMPNLERMISHGFRGLVRGALPSFTNVNNSSIITGVSPAIHGICGNFFYDEEKDSRKPTKRKLKGRSCLVEQEGSGYKSKKKIKRYTFAQNERHCLFS